MPRISRSVLHKLINYLLGIYRTARRFASGRRNKQTALFVEVIIKGLEHETEITGVFFFCLFVLKIQVSLSCLSLKQ